MHMSQSDPCSDIDKGCDATMVMQMKRRPRDHPTGSHPLPDRHFIVYGSVCVPLPTTGPRLATSLDPLLIPSPLHPQNT